MNVAKVKWDPKTLDVKIEFPPKFLELDWITRADILLEMYYQIEERYLEIMEEVTDQEDKK